MKVLSQEQAIELLRSGKDGVREWNTRRNNGEQIPDLSFVDLSRTNLTGVNLKEANLNEADLSKANLSKANLRWANLKGANLSWSNLADADVTYSQIGGTILNSVNWSDAQGIEYVAHAGRSNIDVFTLYRRGLPEVFLRGCGVPENLITNLPSLVAPDAIEFYSCYISYFPEDKCFAIQVHDILQGRGIRCWLELLIDDEVHEHADRGIRMWDKVLLCLSEHSISRWKGEVSHAIDKESLLRHMRKPPEIALIPLNLDNRLFDCEGFHADVLRKRLIADFRGWEADNAKFKSEIEKVINALKTPPRYRVWRDAFDW